MSSGFMPNDEPQEETLEEAVAAARAKYQAELDQKEEERLPQDDAIALGRQKALDQQLVENEQAQAAAPPPSANEEDPQAAAEADANMERLFPTIDSMKQVGKGRLESIGGAREHMPDGLRAAIDVPGHIVAGLFDIPQAFQAAMADVEKGLEDMGIPTGLYWNGDTIVTQRPYELRNSIMNQMIDALPEGRESTHDHPARAITRWVGGFVVTSKVTKAFGLPTALAKLGRTEGAMTSAVAHTNSLLNAGINSMWVQSADEDIIPGLQAMGIGPDEWLDSWKNKDAWTNMEKRIANGMKEFSLGVPMELGAKLLLLLGRSRFLFGRFANLNPESVAAKQLDEAASKAKTKYHELVEILGDPNSDIRIARPGATLKASPLAKPDQVGAAPLSDISDIAQDLTRSLTGRGRFAHFVTPGDALWKRINWGRINAGDDIKRIMSDLSEGFNPEDVVQPRQTHAAIKEQSKQIDMTDMLLKDRAATNPNMRPLTPAEIHAAREMQVAAAEMTQYVARLYEESPSDAKLAAFIRMTNIYREVNRQIRAASATSSRSLNAWSIPVSGDGHALVSEIDRIVGEAGSDAAAVAIAKTIGRAARKGDTDVVDSILSNLQHVGGKLNMIPGAIRSLYYMALLSRVATQVKNVVAGALLFGLKGAEIKGAQVIGDLFGIQNGFAKGSASAHFMGGVHGIADAWRLPQIIKSTKDIFKGTIEDAGQIAATIGDTFDGGVYKAFRENRSGFGAGKVSDSGVGGFSPEAWGLSETSNWNLALRALDTTVSLSQRGLVAADEIMKTANAMAHSRVSAFNQAKFELDMGMLKPEDVTERFQYLSRNPPDGTRLQMIDAAEVGTLTSKNEGAIADVFKAVSSVPVLGKIMMPFSNVPQNSAIQGMIRSPIGLAMPSFWKEISSPDPKVATYAMSRLLLGNFTFGALLSTFSYGDKLRLIGDEPDYKKRDQMERLQQGSMEMHIATREGGFETGHFVRVPFRGFEPTTFNLVVAANIIRLLEADEWDDEDAEVSELLTGVAASTAVSLMNPAMVSNIGDFFTAMDNPEDVNTGLTRYFENAAVTMVTPGVSSQFVSSMDPVQREAFNMLDRIMARTPGMSRDLPLRRDAWGNKLAATPFTGLVPRNVTPEKIEAVDLWLESVGVTMARPSRTYVEFRPGVKIKWEDHPELYSEFLYLRGQGIKDPLDHDEIQVANQVNLAGIRPPAGWVGAGVGLKDELNMLVLGKHPFMQDEWDRKADDERLKFARLATRYYQKAALEIVMKSNKALLYEVDSKARKAAAKETDPRRIQRLEIGF